MSDWNRETTQEFMVKIIVTVCTLGIPAIIKAVGEIRNSPESKARREKRRKRREARKEARGRRGLNDDK